MIELDGTRAGPHIIKQECTDLLKDAAAELLRRVQEGIIHENMAMLTLSKNPDAVEDAGVPADEGEAK